MTPANGCWLLPTYNRATTKLPQFFAAARAAGMTTPGFVIVDRADYKANENAYDRLELPDNWKLRIVEGGSCAAATREAYDALCQDAEWIGWLTDDSIPVTPGWDVKVIEALTPYGFVSTNDDLQAKNGKANGALAFSSDLLRAVGWSVFHPLARHMFAECFWEEIGKMTGCWTVRMDVMVKHMHASKTGEHDETEVHTMRHYDEDERNFRSWKQHDLVAASERVLALMESKGVQMIRPDLSGVSVMIATPAGDGRFDRIFLRSLMETEKLLTQYGAKVHFAEMSNCSDIVLARNRLLSTFIRGADTHCLWIDSDQGWRPIDAVTLLMAKKDFCAVAGVRKVFPPSFAVNVSDDHGRPIPIAVDPATGFLEVTGVGFAFAVTSRVWAERMYNSYPDLAYVAADGREEIGVFNSLVVNRRFLSEDYAACHRWSAIGGKIFVAAEIAIQHAGTFVWDGSWANQLRVKMAEEANAA